MRRLLFSVLVAASVALAPPAAAQLTGEIRAEYIRTALKACFPIQRAMSANNNIADDRIHKYCQCAAAYFADRVSDDDMRRLGTGELKLSNFEALYMGASFYCRGQV